jgi:hypothetical protein
MGTRSLISIKNEDGTHDGVYCHFDGYPDGEQSVGLTLRTNYTSEEKIKALISFGDMSCLHPIVEQCEFYTKRGETLHNYKKLPLDLLRESAKDVGCEYLYMFENGVWIYQELY